MALHLTDEQKKDKALRDNLKQLHNRILSAWSFHQLKTWDDVSKFVPVSDKSQPLNFPALKAFLSKQVDELEQTIKQRYEEHSTSVSRQDESRKESDKDTVSVTHATNVQVLTERNTSVSSVESKVVDKDYGLHKSPNEKAFLFWFQKKMIKECWDKIVKEHKRGILLLAPTGTGKTFMVGGLTRRLEDIQYHENKTWSHIPYLYVTRATVVEQTERVFDSQFGLTVEQLEIINIEQLRSKAGQYWVKEELYIEGGEEHTRWVWKNKINPCVILWDECQALKNEGSTQHQIASSFNELKADTHQVFISATPFTRVSEAKCFAVSTKRNLEHLGFPKGTVLSNETWPAYSNIIAKCDPHEYNEAAVERLMIDLDDYVVRVKGVRPQFEAHNSIQMIDFASKEEFDYYHAAWERYLKEKAKLEAQQLAGGSANTGMMILVQFLKFRMAAEYCRRKHLAKAMYESVQQGKAAVCALNFKNTIIAIVQILVNEYGVPRNQISLVWGGGQTGLTNKQKAKNLLKKKKEALEAAGLSVEEMLEDLDLDEVEDREIQELDPKLRLGTQSKEDRQEEIDRFQSGKSLYCLYTFRAGGVGLSLHHTDELTKEKCRRKESGYAVEEDIPKIPVRQRENYVAPTYSAIELVQGLGRCPRLTSLSPTNQVLLFYRGTIEQDVAAIVSKKLKCLSKVVRNRESWEDVILDNANKSKNVQKHLEAVPEEDGEQTMLGEGDEE